MYSYSVFGCFCCSGCCIKESGEAVLNSCNFFPPSLFNVVYWIDSVGGFWDNICNISVMLVIHRRGDRGTPPPAWRGRRREKNELLLPPTAPASQTLALGMNLAVRIFSSD